MKYELKLLKPVELIGNAFKIFINNLVPLLLISLLTSIPIMIYQYRLSYIDLNYILNPTESNLIAYSSYLFGLFNISIIITAISTGLIIPIISKRYLGKKIKYREYIDNILPRIAPLILLSVLSALISMAGFFLLFVPGVIISLGLSLSNEVFIIEKKGIMDSLKRSWNLTNRKKIYIFGIMALFGIITVIIMLGASKIIENIFTDASGNLKSIFSIIGLIESVLSAIISPFITCGMILVYFNLRIQKEGFTIDDLAGHNNLDDSME